MQQQEQQSHKYTAQPIVHRDNAEMSVTEVVMYSFNFSTRWQIHMEERTSESFQLFVFRL